MNKPVYPTSSVPPLAQVVPMSAEEAAALASRMRVQARLPRIGTAGTVLGLLCGTLTLTPFLVSTDYVVRAMVEGGLSGWGAVLCPLLACGLLLWLAFYSLRLQYQSGATTTGAIEDNLRKIRFILATCMTLSVAAIGVALSALSTGGIWSAALYALSTAVCGVMVNDVRKGLGEFETADERERRRMARGFTVELNAAIPVARVAAPHGEIRLPPEVPPTPVLPMTHDGAGTPFRPGPPPPPAGPALSTLAPSHGESLAVALPGERDQYDRQGERDLRTLLHWLAAVGIAIYVLQSSDLSQKVEAALNTLNAAPAPAVRVNAAFVAGPTPVMTAPAPLRLFVAILIGFAGLAWIAWGILVLNFGARLRVAAYWLAWGTLALVGLATVLNLLAFLELQPSLQANRGRYAGFNPKLFFPHVPELIHAVMLLVLLGRPSVRRLFYRGSEAGEEI